MRLDRFSNPIFDEDDLFNALYQGHELSPAIIVDYTNGINLLEQTADFKFLSPINTDAMTIDEFDAAMQSDWFMPEKYKTMDIEAYLVQVCPEENYQRLIEELQEYQSRNMLELIRWLKYLIDTMTEQDVLWGVGRGSSVASYVLFLIGVHSVDSVKYNLDWREFLR